MRSTEDDSPTRMTRRDIDAVFAICDRHAAKKPPEPFRCSRCEDMGLLWAAVWKRGTPDWHTLRCACGQALDWGPVKYERGTEIKNGREVPRFEIRHENRPFSCLIPTVHDFTGPDGRPLTDDQIFTCSARSRMETMIAARDQGEDEERAAIQAEGEPDYTFDGNLP